MSGTTANLDNSGSSFDNGNDGIVIIKNLEVVPGGRTLDTTGFTPSNIKEGHLVIEETATGVLKPMPVSGTDYDSLPAGHTYAGVVISTVLTTKPFVSVLLRGSVNHEAAPYGMSSILAAVKTALPLIIFTKE